MLTDLKAVALATGFTIIIAKSDTTVKDQLNRITKLEELPIALITWELNVNVEFDDGGRLMNPKTQITMLLVDKATDLSKDNMELKAEEVGNLFIKFMRNYRTHLFNNTNVKQNPITGISFTYAPSFGAGKHSGILARFTTQMDLQPDCTI